MEDNALVFEMIRSTMELFVGIKKGNMHMEPFLQGEVMILHFLDQHGRAALPGELSAKLSASSARVAIALRNLEKKGYIERNIDRADRRKVLVTITGEGRRLVMDDKKIMHKKMSMVLERLGESDAREYIRIVGRISEIVGEHNDFLQGVKK